MLPESTARGPAMVTRALCASLALVKGSVMDQMLVFRNERCTPRSMRTARVALLHVSGWFITWFEGADDAVDAALHEAGQDVRSAHLKLLHRSRGPATLHEPILVSTTSAPLRPAQYAQHVMRARQHPLTEGDPRALWDQLSAPVIIDTGPNDRVPVRHTALVSAEEHAPIDVLRKLGDKHRSPLVYQRFGGTARHSPDIGAAYVDVQERDGIARIHFLSRRALEHPLAQFTLADIDSMYFIPGQHQEAAVQTAARVARCLKGLPVPPPVHFVGAMNDAARACVQLLERSGITRVLRTAMTGTNGAEQAAERAALGVIA